MNFDNHNEQFYQALQFVTHTRKNIFITGKAGTGKTTFLKYIRGNCFKKMVVTAPTGVAAINAGGVTLHSFFQLPFGAFIPSVTSGCDTYYNGAFNNKHTLLKNSRIQREKRKLINELELLIIDEVSMVRADLLDAIDTVLRAYRKNSSPFGGVQVVLIGDLYQLPPVVTDPEWQLLQEYYKSPFFFDALVIKESPLIYLELKKIYRQKDERFINLLNNIRNNVASNADLGLLNTYYQPGFQPHKNCITLTTHNARADNINASELNKLPSKAKTFEAVVKGEFYEKSYPAEKTLTLKEGAQIMFIKNDKGEARKYFNGKIGIVSKIHTDSIKVTFPGEANELEIEQETWKNIRYTYSTEHDEIEEDELGSFSQYPVRLAWAITIHKSQGLTFDKAVIDAGASFAAGQVYVALSRLISLDGLVLFSQVSKDAIQTDERIITFAESELDAETLSSLLETSQKEFIGESLIQCFDFKKLLEDFRDHHEEYANRQIPGKEKAIEWSHAMTGLLQQQKDVADKFLVQLQRLIPGAEADRYQLLHERIKAAAAYFTKSLSEAEALLKQHVDQAKVKSKTKNYLKRLNTLQFSLKHKSQQIKNAEQAAGTLSGDRSSKVPPETFFANKYNSIKETELPPLVRQNTKPQKGESQRTTLQLFREGRSIKEIAEMRVLASSTIESHLTSFVLTGEIEITKLVSKNKITVITRALQQIESRSTTAVIEIVGNGYSHAEIRAVMNHLEFSKRVKEEQEKSVFL